MEIRDRAARASAHAAHRKIEGLHDEVLQAFTELNPVIGDFAEAVLGAMQRLENEVVEYKKRTTKIEENLSTTMHELSKVKGQLLRAKDRLRDIEDELG